MSAKLDTLLDRLEERGFYRYVPSQGIPELKDEARATGYVYGLDSGREYLADAEDLAEGGVGAFLETIRPFLLEQGVRLYAIEEEFTEHGYSITINGTTYPLYSEADPAFKNMAAIWKQTAVRAFGIVNTLLRQAGSPERVFGLAGGHEQSALFLTTELYDLLQHSGLFAKHELPTPIPYL